MFRPGKRLYPVHSSFAWHHGSGHDLTNFVSCFSFKPTPILPSSLLETAPFSKKKRHRIDRHGIAVRNRFLIVLNTDNVPPGPGLLFKYRQKVFTKGAPGGTKRAMTRSAVFSILMRSRWLSTKTTLTSALICHPPYNTPSTCLNKQNVAIILNKRNKKRRPFFTVAPAAEPATCEMRRDRTK